MMEAVMRRDHLARLSLRQHAADRLVDPRRLEQRQQDERTARRCAWSSTKGRRDRRGTPRESKCAADAMPGCYRTLPYGGARKSG